MKKILSVLSVSLLLSMPAFAQSNVAINSFAFVEKVKVENGKEIKSLEKATNVIPGETVIFKNVVENKNNNPAKDIVVNNQVPKEISFNSAFSSDEKNTQYEFSVDGVNFQKAEKLMIKDKVTGNMRVARPEEYTNIRWIYTQGVPAQSKIEFNYKGVLK